MRFQVVVGNIGTIYSGNDEEIARREYAEYCELSQTGIGRAGGEPVTLFEDGEPIAEFHGSNDQADS